MNLNNLSISRKLWGAILFLLVAMLVVAGFTMRRAQTVQLEAFQQVALTHELTQKAILWKGMTETAVARNLASTISADPSVGAFFKENLANDAPRVAKLREEIAKQAQSDEDKAELKNIVALGGTLLAASKKTRELGGSGDVSGVEETVKKEYVPRWRPIWRPSTSSWRCSSARATTPRKPPPRRAAMW
jgi:methyl-accepting chemotaxis protein